MRLYNVTDTVVETYGSVQHSNNEEYSSSKSQGIAYLDLASPKTFQLEHRCNVTNAAGFSFAPQWGGYAVNSAVECFRLND